MAESAIPAHLQRPRVRTVRVPGDYEPPYPSFSARYRPSVTQVVMAYFGIQWRGPRPEAVDLALDRDRKRRIDRLQGGHVRHPPRL